MKTIEALQMNIHEVKLQLNKARRVICADELQKAQAQGNIDYCLSELLDLKFSLQCAINQESKK